MVSFSKLKEALKRAGHTDAAGKEASNGIFGQRHAESRQIQVQANFRYNIPGDSFLIFSADGTSGTSGTGNYGVDASADAGVGYVETGTGSSGSAIVQDRNRVRYRPGQESGAIFTARFTTDADTTLAIGLFDNEDGFFLEHNGSEYRFVNRDTESDNVYSRSDWIDPLDGSGPSGVSPDLSDLNIFRITFGYLGTAPAYLEYFAGPLKGWITAERIDFTAMSNGTNVRNPTLPLRMEASRSSGSNNGRLGSGSWMGYVLTNDEVDPGIRRFDTEGRRDTVSSSTDEHIITVQNKTTYQSVDNDIQIIPELLNPISDADDVTTFYVVRDAVTADSRSYTDRNTNNSVVEVSTTATTVNSEEKVIARQKIPSSSNQTGSKGIQTELESQRIEPGESITIYANTPGTPALYEAVFRWRELF
jgi:hypothetical protein